MTTDLHTRAFPTNVELNEGRLFARLVPYGAVAMVVDDLPGGGLSEPYVEGFRRGAFQRQAAMTLETGMLQRVLLTHEHGGDRLGPLVGLDERDDGLYGEFRVLPTRRDDVTELHSIGIREISIEFRERPNGTVVENKVRWRTDAHLAGAALVSRGAYGAAGAEVLALRSLDELIAEQAAADEARMRAEVDAAAEAEAATAAADALAAEAAAADERRRQIEDLDTWLTERREQQAELVDRYGCVS